MSTTVSSLVLTIDDAHSDGFQIELNGSLFTADNFTLSQHLMQPNTLHFRLRKGPLEDENEPQFRTCGAIIGKDVTISLSTDHVETVSAIVSQEDKTEEIRFKGIIVSASGSRYQSAYYIDVEAKSHEALLLDNPTCKSFEKKTLNEIVEDVIDDYSDSISAQIDARFTEALPYTVQYNETNYQFLQRLAQRYGEWLYNDGEHLVFGKLPEGESVTLGYPDKDIPGYNVDLRMQHVAFGHLASSYNSDYASKKEGLEEMERAYNTLADQVFDSSQRRMTKSTLQNLHSGGFADTDGSATILNVSTKTQARGEKAGMLTYSGTTFCPRLRIGGTLVIMDNFLPNDLAGQTSDVEQAEILVTELVHNFSADDTYSNHFTGIPAACDYPPYINSDVFPAAPPCRAKVTDTEDPNNLGRIRVQFDWQAQLDEQMMTPWLRIAQPYAGGGKGFSFIPEIGEEVMIGFESGNAERPYVNGTLYNGVGNPDGKWLPGDNQVKAIRTRNGHTIEIWDAGQGGYIRIYDNEKENYILTFSTDEKLIKLESTGNIELYAKNDIIMHAGHDINASADHDISVVAGNDRNLNVGHNQSVNIRKNEFINIGQNKDENIKLNSQLSAQNIRLEADLSLIEYSTTHQQRANATMSLSASNQVDVKGNIVKVN